MGVLKPPSIKTEKKIMAEKYVGKAINKLLGASENLVIADLDKLSDVDASAAEIDALDGITSIVGELNLVDDMPANVTFAYAAGAANVAEVTITVVDSAGVAIAEAFVLDVYLSDAATGVGITGTSASGTVQAKAASGADLAIVTAKKHLQVQTLATGIYILEITDVAKTAFYPCAVIPSIGKIAIGAVMASGDYGA
jgi:hypothetical protein